MSRGSLSGVVTGATSLMSKARWEGIAMAKVTKAALTRMVESLVANGVEALDDYFDTHEHVFGWRERINVRTLDVGDIMQCPLAQVFGGYGMGLRTLFPYLSNHYEAASPRGFNVADNYLAREALGIEDFVMDASQERFLWAELNRLWRKAVRTGRPAVNAATS